MTPLLCAAPGATSLDKALQDLGLQRHQRSAVGRLRGNCFFVHRQYEGVLPGAALSAAKALLPRQWSYAVIKHDENINAFTFFAVPAFDTDAAPRLGDSCTVKRDGSITRRNGSQRGLLCHDKWLLVRDDYQGFDVTAAKQHSLRWRAVPGVNRALIHYGDYWAAQVAPRIESVF